MSTPNADILNITQAYKLLLRILCRYFNAFTQITQGDGHVKKHCSRILHDSVLTHARRSETFWYSEVRNSLLVNLVQKLSKSVNI